MTTEEKLKHFQEICMTDAREKSAKILDDYAKTLDKAYEEHTEDARKRAMNLSLTWEVSSKWLRQV